jgi:hypothetical protein
MTPAQTLPKPAPFLTVRCHRTDLSPSLCGLCVGYERKTWRAEQLADHIVSWLPEFALTSTEIASLNHANAVELIRKAAQTVYQTDKFAKRGEFGELFLHAAIRQVHDSLPAISKIYYKSAVNDTVKGFDAVHVVGPPDDMELWLGEAKFYDDIGRAIRDVTKEIQDHLATDYLRSEFLLIGNKIDDGLPHSDALKRLLAQETSLDEVFSRACIPVLLTYDSDCVASYDQVCTQYISAFETEVTMHHATFNTALKNGDLPTEVRVHLFLLPLWQKAALVEILDRKLKTWQQI